MSLSVLCHGGIRYNVQGKRANSLRVQALRCDGAGTRGQGGVSGWREEGHTRRVGETENGFTLEDDSCTSLVNILLHHELPGKQTNKTKHERPSQRKNCEKNKNKNTLTGDVRTHATTHPRCLKGLHEIFYLKVFRALLLEREVLAALGSLHALPGAPIAPLLTSFLPEFLACTSSLRPTPSFTNDCRLQKIAIDNEIQHDGNGQDLSPLTNTSGNAIINTFRKLCSS